MTFPFPTGVYTFPFDDLLADAGNAYIEQRSRCLIDRSEGMAEFYSHFHNPDETSVDIEKLRQLLVEMDNAVATAYGWLNLDLNHGFHETKQGVRYTISEVARHEVLSRLIKLNQERNEKEVHQGLQDKRNGTAYKSRKKRKNVDDGPSLFN